MIQLDLIYMYRLLELESNFGLSVTKLVSFLECSLYMLTMNRSEPLPSFIDYLLRNDRVFLILVY